MYTAGDWDEDGVSASLRMVPAGENVSVKDCKVDVLFFSMIADGLPVLS